MTKRIDRYLIINFTLVDKLWTEWQISPKTKLIKIENEMDEPIGEVDENVLNRVQGSLIGMALGDTLGAHVEFRPHEYLLFNSVKHLEEGRTRGLDKGQVGLLFNFLLLIFDTIKTSRNHNY